MQPSIIQLIVLAGIAIFLILKLRSVLGTREGFEKPPEAMPVETSRSRRPDLEVIEGGPDRDIVAHVAEGSEAAKALAAMKRAEPSFNVTEFLTGARGAHEMIIMAFERGELAPVKPYLAPEVYDAFATVVEERQRKGWTVDATFVGISNLQLRDAEFDAASREGEITVQFVAELTSVVRDNAGDIVEGNPNEIKKQKSVWTFARKMGTNDPNWILVATAE